MTFIEVARGKLKGCTPRARILIRPTPHVIEKKTIYNFIFFSGTES